MMTLNEILQIILRESTHGCATESSTISFFDVYYGRKLTAQARIDLLQKVKVLANVINFAALRENAEDLETQLRLETR